MDAGRAYAHGHIRIVALALGGLTWFSASDPQKPRVVPVVLIPACLEYYPRKGQWRLVAAEGELLPNISLGEFLRGEFGCDLAAMSL
ncbi:MAG TPA: DUF4011 domain-containing protein, partial [Aliiroseovarius sp.]|nr:DUF4011 domain-containing protein [Aliiroseovarius sp.]